MDEVASELVTGAWETMGVSGALFLVLMAVIGGIIFVVYKVTMKWLDNQKSSKKTPAPAPTVVKDDKGTPGVGTVQLLARKEVDRARTDARAYLNALKQELSDYKESNDKRVDEIKEEAKKGLEDLKKNLEKSLDKLNSGHESQEKWQQAMDKEFTALQTEWNLKKNSD